MVYLSKLLKIDFLAINIVRVKQFFGTETPSSHIKDSSVKWELAAVVPCLFDDKYKSTLLNEGDT